MDYTGASLSTISNHWHSFPLFCSLWGLHRVLVHNTRNWCSWDKELHKLTMQLHHGPPIKSQHPINHNLPPCGNSNCHSHSHKCCWSRNLCDLDQNGTCNCRWSQPPSNDSETRCIKEVLSDTDRSISDWNLQFWRSFVERKQRTQGTNPCGSYGLWSIVWFGLAPKIKCYGFHILCNTW